MQQQQQHRPSVNFLTRDKQRREQAWLLMQASWGDRLAERQFTLNEYGVHSVQNMVRVDHSPNEEHFYNWRRRYWKTVTIGFAATIMEE